MGIGTATAHQALKTDSTPDRLVRTGCLISCQVWFRKLRTNWVGQGLWGQFFDLKLSEASAGKLGLERSFVSSTSDHEWKTVREALPTMQACSHYYSNVVVIYKVDVNFGKSLSGFFMASLKKWKG